MTMPPCERPPEVARHYEYGVRHAKSQDILREGMTRDEAKWLREWLAVGGAADAFRLVRRPVGDWEAA